MKAQELKKQLETRLQNAELKLQNFSQELETKKYAYFVFEWADGAFKAAAEQLVYSEYLENITGAIEAGNMTDDEIVEEFKKWMEKDLKSFSISLESMSTSQSTNILERNRVAVISRLMDSMVFFL